jgi:hypothetical protein
VQVWLQRLRQAVVCVVTLLVCIAIHEFGHTVAGCLTGGRVKEVVLLSARPHVRLAGSSRGAVKAARAAAGTGLFALTWFIVALVLPRSLFLSVSSLVAFAEGCGWLLSAVLYPYGPRSEDGWKFIAASGFHPGWIAAAAVLLSGAGWLLVQGKNPARLFRAG